MKNDEILFMLIKASINFQILFGKSMHRIESFIWNTVLYLVDHIIHHPHIQLMNMTMDIGHET